MNLLDLEFLATCSGPHRYPLEKNGHGRKPKLCKEERVHANTFERYQSFRAVFMAVIHERAV